MELEEVTVLNPETPVVNPPEVAEAEETEEMPAPAQETEEEVSEPETEEVEQNPKGGITGAVKGAWNKANGILEQVTGGVSIIQLGIGAVGIVAATVVPKVVKWNTGWKDLVVTTVTAALGGFILGKMSKPVAVAFVIGCGGVLFLKFIKWAMAGFKDVPLLLSGAGQQPVLGEEFEFEGFDEGPIYNVAESGVYDIGQEPEIHPTADIGDDIF